MSGAPGSGKSTLSLLLQRSLGGLAIDHDILRSTLLADYSLPFDSAARHAYNLQWAMAMSAASQGLNVIVDSPCNDVDIVRRGSHIAGRYGLEYWHVECRVDDIDVLDERLRTREYPMRSQRTGVDIPPIAAGDARMGEDGVALFRKWMNPYGPAGNVIVVESTGSPEVRRDEVLRTLGVGLGAGEARQV